MSLRKVVFHPLFVLLTALLAATLYAIVRVMRHPDAPVFGLLYYVVPIVIPFMAFLFERAQFPARSSMLSLVTDSVVVGLAIACSFTHIPGLSGHALFLSYTLLSTQTRLTRISAAFVMLIVIYAKIIIMHDPVTLAGGTLLGVLAAMFVRWHRTR